MRIKLITILSIVICILVSITSCSTNSQTSKPTTTTTQKSSQTTLTTTTTTASSSVTTETSTVASSEDPSYDFNTPTEAGDTITTTAKPFINNFLTWSNNNFWRTGVIYNETVVIYQAKGKEANGYLMYNPTQILSVKSYDLKTTYVKGKDYIISGNKITLTKDSPIQILTEAQYKPSDSVTPNSINYRVGGGYILYTENGYLVNKQITVTYKFNKSLWKGAVPVSETTKLAQTRAKLHKKQSIEEVIIGDSIGTGCNASSFLGISPKMPPWFVLIEQKLENDFGSAINIDNYSKGGQTTDYGVAQASAAADKKPDLVIIEYGMNDGSYKMANDVYKNNIITMINTIRAKAPNSEFILCAPILANPDTVQFGTQEAYITVLKDISATMSGVAVADFTTMNKAMLLNNKRYFDLSANDINHPNDFLQTAMAAQIVEMFK